MTHDMTIGGLSGLADVKIPTIRYYESIGLLPKPSRSEGGRRVYGEDALRRLRFVRHARDLGFEIDAIRELLSLADGPSRPCGAADAIARQHAAEIDTKMARLKRLRKELTRMVDDCMQRDIRTCKVIEVLADPRPRKPASVAPRLTIGAKAPRQNCRKALNSTD